MLGQMNRTQRPPNVALRRERDLRGWSQRRLAAEIDADENTVSRWERGHRTPDPYHRERLCTLFGKNAEDLGFLATSPIATIPMYDLSALLEHPDFVLGVAEAERHFPKFYEPAPLTEDEMIEEVETNLGRAITEDESSYICRLGYVFGIINEGLTPDYILDYNLSPLLEHPEFLRGVDRGQQMFSDDYEPAPLTEDEMIDEVEMNLVYHVYTRSVSLVGATGGRHCSYIESLGIVYGIINEGLTYTIG